MTSVSQEQELANARFYTRNEQMSSLRRIIHNYKEQPQRTLARLVWIEANGVEPTDGDQSFYISPSFARDAAALKGVPLATVYNRIRRILGLIK